MKVTKEFSWELLWKNTEERAEQSGYAHPHTAMQGARAFAKTALKDGSHDEEELIEVHVWKERPILSHPVEKIQDGVKYWAGTLGDFVK